jgi:predicted acylesterase/phospholipase RssA
VLEALEQELNKTNTIVYSQLKGIAGSSIGSILAVCIMLQYNAMEVRTFFTNLVEKFKNDNLAQSNLLTFFQQKGVVDTAAIGGLIKLLITTKLGTEKQDITMLALYEKTHKVLAIGAQNLTMERYEILDYQSVPHLPVWKAVCMSCAIPFVFHPVEFNNCLYIDPAMSQPIPYTVFPIMETLICYIQGYHGYSKEIGVMEYLCRVLHGVEQATHNQIEQMPQELRLRFLKLRLPCCSANPNGFSLDEKLKTKLIDIGRTTTFSLFHYKAALLTQAVLANAHILKFTKTPPE